MWLNGLLATVLTISVITDLRSRKIYNNVLLPGWIAALGLHGWLEGWAGLGFALAGGAVGFALLFIPYLMGGMGAGDVKLLAVVGAVKGVTFVFNAALYMAIVGALLALFVLLLQSETRLRLVWMVYCVYCVRFGHFLPLKAQRAAMSATYPYGVAIAGGTLLCLWRTDGGWV